MQSKTAIFICSCDKYSDLWPTLESSFKMHWPDCPYETYLHTNEISNIEYGDISFSLLRTGPDINWSTNLLNALKLLDHEYILFWIDDAFLKTKVINKNVEELIKYVDDNNLDCLRLRKHPRLNNYGSNGIGIVEPDTPYRHTIFGMIWRKDALLDLIVKGEDPWEFEIKGSFRGHHLKVHSLSYDFFDIYHGVIKGKWVRRMKEKLIKENYVVSSKRVEMDFLESLNCNLELFRANIFHALPFKIRNKLLRHKWKTFLD